MRYRTLYDSHKNEIRKPHQIDRVGDRPLAGQSGIFRHGRPDLSAVMSLRFGIAFLVIAMLFVAIAEIRENVQAKYVTALKTPVSLSGIVTSPRFHTGLSTMYDVYIRFTSKEDDPRVFCRLQYASNDKRCRTVPPILDATWELLDDRRTVPQGHAPRRLACCSSNGSDTVDANLAETEHRRQRDYSTGGQPYAHRKHANSFDTGAGDVTELSYPQPLVSISRE
jgi:hypothetical protein